MAFQYLILLAMVVAPALSYSAGAPNIVCGTLTPQHGVAAQASVAPYTIQLQNQKVRGGGAVAITITGNTNSNTIKGIIVQARQSGKPVGQFTIADNSVNHLQTLNCDAQADSITHKKIEGANPQSVSFNWVAPQGIKGPVDIVATVALNGGTFWVGILPSERLIVV